MPRDLLCNSCKFYQRYRLVRQTLGERGLRGSEQDYKDCIKGIRYLVANQCTEFDSNPNAKVKVKRAKATADAFPPVVTITTNPRAKGGKAAKVKVKRGKADTVLPEWQ